jgi:glycosyltransferase involved in cell wall biosynthesis
MARSLPEHCGSASMTMTLLDATLNQPGPNGSDSPHVLTLTPFYPSSSDPSAGCFVAEPLPALEACGIKTSILAVQPFYRGRLSADKSFPANWVRYASLPSGMGLASSGMLLYARLLPLVRELHRQQPIALIHAHAPLPCGHAAALLSRKLHIPFVVTVHGLDAYATNQVRGLAGRWCRNVSRMVYSSAAKVICVSQKVREAVLQGATGPGNAVVIYNSVDSDLFSPESPSRTRKAILSVGNLIPIKGHEMLLRALAAIFPDFPELRWEVVGDGPERPRLAALAASLGIAEKVRFHGRLNRKQVAEAVRSCSLFALPSRYEGLGCVYLEAMSAGKPVIACHGQGIEEVIQHGTNGYLVAPDDRERLTVLVSKLLRDAKLREATGAAARSTILEGFTLAHQARQLAALYRECLG